MGLPLRSWVVRASRRGNVRLKLPMVCLSPSRGQAAADRRLLRASARIRHDTAFADYRDPRASAEVVEPANVGSALAGLIEQDVRRFPRYIRGSEQDAHLLPHLL